ncbi:MAG: hypothetical protein ABS951_04190 [Solibacillus sp.]
MKTNDYEQSLLKTSPHHVLPDYALPPKNVEVHTTDGRVADGDTNKESYNTTPGE